MAFQIPDDQAATATLTFRDARGETGATPPGPVVWSVSDPTLATVTPSADGMTASVQPQQGSGSFTIAASSGTLADTSESIDITPGAAVSGTIDLTLTPRASAEEAQQVHEGKHRVGGSHWS